MHDPAIAGDPSRIPIDLAVGHTAGEVAHLLRTPLTTIRGRVQLARRRLRDSSASASEAATIDACLGAIDEAVERLDRSIDEVLHPGGVG